MTIDTDAFSTALRSRSIDLARRRILVTAFAGSDQEKDLSEPANCGGLGRIRHFRRGPVTSGWPPNPLPLDPAARYLGIPAKDGLRAQVFQNASCNWRCWYCFVDFKLLSADERFARWVDTDNLIATYLAESDPPAVIDLTGGQPDLVPEWVLWVMDGVEAAGCSQRVYLWSDDNLSNDYFWRYLDDTERCRIATYKGYGKVCCFKGYDETSFVFNTLADSTLFDRQFDLFRRLLRTGIDLYAYATFTTPEVVDLRDRMRRFIDRLQNLAPELPLRTVPLKIDAYTPVRPRMKAGHSAALEYQFRAIEAWNEELEHRFSAKDRAKNVVDVRLQ